MWFCVLAIYLPFVIIMINRHEAREMSLSAISSPDNMHYLVLYVAFTVLFSLHQLLFLNRNFAGNHKWIYNMSLFSCSFIVIGAFIPFRAGDPDFFFLNHLHTYVTQVSTSTFLVIGIITLVLSVLKSRYKLLLSSLYGMFAIYLVLGFLHLGTSAKFTLLLTLSYSFVLVSTNTVFFILKKSCSINENSSENNDCKA